MARNNTEAARLFTSKLEATSRTDASELRKTLKPLMEKRRRARINESLEQLKILILPLVGKDKSRYSKFEKADVLEMTVRFLRRLPSTPTKSPSACYREGYKACLQRVSALLSKTSPLDKDTCQRVNEYIQRSMSAWESPPCQNCKCNGQNNQGAPQTNARALSFLSTGAGNSRNSDVQCVSSSQAVPQAISMNMWRPW